MNRTFTIWLVKRGCVVILWAVFYGWVAAGSALEFFSVEFVSPVAVGVGAGFFAMYSLQMKRYAPVLIAFGLATAALAYAWLYALLGSGKTVYHRASALNAFSPYEG